MEKKRSRPENSELHWSTFSDEYLEKVEKLGGRVLMPKTYVPGWGYLSICLDTENNTLGLWQDKEETE